jgi:hypothetical protein
VRVRGWVDGWMTVMVVVFGMLCLRIGYQVGDGDCEAFWVLRADEKRGKLEVAGWAWAVK